MRMVIGMPECSECMYACSGLTSRMGCSESSPSDFGIGLNGMAMVGGRALSHGSSLGMCSVNTACRVPSIMQNMMAR